jgi:hypothetical protein
MEGTVRMQPRLRIILAVTAVAVTGVGVGTALAASIQTGALLAVQPGGQYVFACVSEKTGAVAYFEFRPPLPHQCSAPDPSASPSPSPTPTPTTS